MPAVAKDTLLDKDATTEEDIFLEACARQKLAEENESDNRTRADNSATAKAKMTTVIPRNQKRGASVRNRSRTKKAPIPPSRTRAAARSLTRSTSRVSFSSSEPVALTSSTLARGEAVAVLGYGTTIVSSSCDGNGCGEPMQIHQRGAGNDTYGRDRSGG